MKKKLLILLAVAALIATVIAAPAGAFRRQSLRGYQDLYFNFGIMTGEGAAFNDPAATGLAYVGTLDLGGDTYDIAYFSHGPPTMHGDWAHFEETVRIYPPDTVKVKWGVTTKPGPAGLEGPPPLGSQLIDTFVLEGEVLVEFTDKGWVSPRGTGFAWGKVINAPSDFGGALDRVAEGDRTFWHGRYLDDARTRFAGPFRIFTRG